VMGAIDQSHHSASCGRSESLPELSYPAPLGGQKYIVPTSIVGPGTRWYRGIGDARQGDLTAAPLWRPGGGWHVLRSRTPCGAVSWVLGGARNDAGARSPDRSPRNHR